VYECDHQWPERKGTVRCELCQAVGFFNVSKDPFGNEQPAILKPPERDWRQLSYKERHKIFERNKQHILIDAQQIGRAKTCEKWSMAPSTLSQLLEIWDFPRAVKETAPAAVAVLELPPLPPFNPDWPAEVQAKWLDVYALVLQRKKVK
jgi:hypothetical protein